MSFPSCPVDFYGYIPREFQPIKSLTPAESSSEMVSQRTLAQHAQGPRQPGNQNCVMTVYTAVVLGCLSAYFLASALIKFGQVLTVAPQSHVEIPADLTSQALRQLR